MSKNIPGNKWTNNDCALLLQISMHAVLEIKIKRIGCYIREMTYPAYTFLNM